MDPIKVLLVEDDEDDYLLTRRLLAAIGESKYALRWAPSYEEGLLRIASNPYDICLLDYRLGARSGLDLLCEVRRCGSSVPVILLTGVGDKEIDFEATKAGATDYLLKGEINATLLERAIRYAIAAKRHEEQRFQLALAQAAGAQAEAANRAKDEFLAMVSHELRAPLNAMLVWLGVLKEPKLDPATATKALATVERNAQQQTRILDDLLDMTRIMHGMLRIEKRPIQLAAVVEAAVANVRPAAEAKSIAIEVTRDPTLDLVTADPGRLQQIVVNLLSNSVKFTPAEGRVEIGLASFQGPAGPQAQITVVDTGVGISASALPYVFDRYRQAQGSYSGSQVGLGLGLAIVRSLVELHGGSVQAESPGVGLGAKFTVRLPFTSVGGGR